MNTNLRIKQLLIFSICFIVCACAYHPKQIALDDKTLTAETHVNVAMKLINNGDYLQAGKELEMALQQNPATPGIYEALQKLQSRKRAEDLYMEATDNIKTNQYESAKRYLNESLILYPEFSAASTLLANLENNLTSDEVYSDKLVSFDFQDMMLSDVFTALASVANINLLIDDTVDRSKLVTANLDNANVKDVMYSLAASHGLMLVNIQNNTTILSTDTPENKARYAREDVSIFVLRYADAEILRKILEPVSGNAVILADKRTNSLVVRTTSDKIPLIKELVNALDIRESEVLIEVEILEITHNKLNNLGLDLGDNPVVQADFSGNVKNTGQPGTFSMSQLRHIGTGQVFLTVPSIYLNLLKNDHQTRILANPRLRIVNRTPARLHIGEKVPIKMTSSLFRDSSEELSSYEYRNVGIVMNLTPRILSETELSVDLKLEVSSILQASTEGHPTIGTREVETTLRLQDGQVEVIAGLLKDEERKGKSRIPLLGDVPVLGSLFASRNDDAIQTDIVISLTPHIMDKRVMTAHDRSLWQGYTENSNSKSDNKARIRYTNQLSTINLNSEIAENTENTKKTETADSLPGNSNLVIVAVEPPENSVLKGSESEAEITISDGVNIGSVPFYLDYDPNIIDIVSVEEGPFMGSDGATTAFMSSIHKQRGRIIIGLSRVGAVGGISGSGTLIKILFRGIKQGNSPLAFSHEQVLDPSAETIPARFNSGLVIVSNSKN